MAEDSGPTGELELDPEADNQDEQDTDTGENNQQAQQPSQEDLQAQLLALEATNKNLQAWNTREAQTRRRLEDQILATRQRQGQQPAIDPADPLASERAALEAQRQQVIAEREWSAIQRDTPPEIVEAYTEFQRAWSLDPSPRGAVNGFAQAIVTLAAKLAEGQPAPKPTPQAKPKPQARSVDTTRSDAPDLDAIDKQIAGAKERKDLAGMVGALLRRGPTPQGTPPTR